jgi:hypothetical protein
MAFYVSVSMLIEVDLWEGYAVFSSPIISFSASGPKLLIFYLSRSHSEEALRVTVRDLLKKSACYALAAFYQFPAGIWLLRRISLDTMFFLSGPVLLVLHVIQESQNWKNPTSFI